MEQILAYKVQEGKDSAKKEEKKQPEPLVHEAVKAPLPKIEISGNDGSVLNKKINIQMSGVALPSIRKDGDIEEPDDFIKDFLKRSENNVANKKAPYDLAD